MSVIQAIATAGGLAAKANSKNAFILRPVLDTSRRAVIPIDLKGILKGQASDRPLLPNDVLVVSKGKSIEAKDLPIVLGFALGLISLGITLTR